MDIKLTKAKGSEASEILALFQLIFGPYLAKYHDDDINPAHSSLERIESWFDKDFMCLYFIELEGKKVGFIRLAHITWDFEGQDKIHIADFGILPDFQNQGIGQEVLRQIEVLHQPKDGWELSTILQEAGNLHLYEKFGYKRTGLLTHINEKWILWGLKKMNIKICGNQTKESVDTAVEYGATHIGFILSAGYKRSVSTDKVVSMAADVPASVKKVGVFVNEDIATVEKLSAVTKIDIVQLHGKEDQLYINKLTLPVIKVISSVSEATKYAENVLLLIDHEAGKSGASIDRNQDFSLIRQKFMIAGGLVPETVAETVRYFRQYPNFIGLDVSSGVESDGQKNAEKIKSFIKNARET